MRFKIRAALVCDQVRTENNGKQILIGVYLGDALFQAMPAKFAPTFWVQMDTPVREGTAALEAKIEVPGRAKPLVASTELDVKPGQTGALLVLGSGTSFDVTEEGEMALFIRSPRGRWQKVIALRLGLTQPGN